MKIKMNSLDPPARQKEQEENFFPALPGKHSLILDAEFQKQSSSRDLLFTIFRLAAIKNGLPMLLLVFIPRE
jgi:hypothetical protein